MQLAFLIIGVRATYMKELECECAQLKHELLQAAKARSPEYQQRVVAKLERKHLRHPMWPFVIHRTFL